MKEIETHQPEEKINTVEQHNEAHTPLFLPIVALLLGAMIVFGLSSCAPSGADKTVADETANIDGLDDETDETTAGEIATNDGLSNSSDVNSAAKVSPDKILIAYFSPGIGNTEQVAQWVADDTGGTLYAIEAAEPYTEEDLNDFSDTARISVEQEDETARPALGGTPIDDMSQYDVIILGYPIWHDYAPRVVDTFLETYDLADKTIYPFCTAGSSSIDESENQLQQVAPDAKWSKGDAFTVDASKTQVEEWIDSIGLAK